MLRNYSICGRGLRIDAPFFPANSENWEKFLVKSAKSDITVECKIPENLPEIDGEWSKRDQSDYCIAENVLYKRIYMGCADGAVIKTALNDFSKKEITFAESSFKTLMDERYMWSTIGLAESLLFLDSLLMHASYIEVDGEAILFTAPCGTGKSTQAELWRKFAGATVINGDKAGISYIRSIIGQYGVEKEYFEKHDFHVHIPEGAVPKDGPSAGITMATAMLSAIIEKPVKASVAMTGEITLRGRVLPIGGLKEKILAAKNAGIKTVLVPKKNEKDIEEISAEIKRGIEIIFVENKEQVVAQALVL